MTILLQFLLQSAVGSLGFFLLQFPCQLLVGWLLFRATWDERKRLVLRTGVISALVFPPAYMLTGVLCDRFAQLVEGGSFLMNGIGGVVLLLGIIPASLLAFCNFTAASILLRRDSSAAGLAIDPWASRKGPSGYALRRKVALWALLSAPSMLVIMVVAGCVLMLLADSR